LLKYQRQVISPGKFLGIQADRPLVGKHRRLIQRIRLQHHSQMSRSLAAGGRLRGLLLSGEYRIAHFGVEAL